MPSRQYSKKIRFLLVQIETHLGNKIHYEQTSLEHICPYHPEDLWYESFCECANDNKDRIGNIWIGTWGGGVMQLNPRSDRFEVNFRINSFMYQPLITALELDNTNNLWVGTTDGLVYYEIKNQLADRLTQNHGLAGNDITVVYSDSKNNVWVGSRGKGISKIAG